MALVNTSKPTTSISNNSKVSIGETWGSITTTWATETRTWAAVSQLFTNSTKGTIQSLWSLYTFPWALSLPWTSDSGMTNTSKPI